MAKSLAVSINDRIQLGLVMTPDTGFQWEIGRS